MKKIFSLWTLILIAIVFTSCENNISISKKPSRYIASDYLHKINGSENLPKGVKELLDEEQNLHNKDLWGKNAFASNINPKYVPEENPKFPLPYYLIQEEDAKFIQAGSLDKKIDEQLSLLVSGTKYYKLFVHPESEAHYEFLKNAYRYIGPEETEFLASPTSSYRSLVVWNKKSKTAKPFIAKVSLDKNVIGSIDRLVSENEVERSVANQKVFDRMGKEALDEMNVKIFPESAGLIFQRELDGAPKKLGGQLIREIPEEVLSGTKKWISFSAMMSPNRTPPFIMDVIKSSGLTSYDFFREYMIKSYLEMFENLSLKSGVNFEPHSQNLVFETTNDLKPTGKWVIRDFGGVWPDAITMAKNKGPIDVYMETNNAAKFKLRGGRGNYISSYVFFYKRQVFDMMLEEVAKFDPSMTLEKKNKLKKEIDTAYLKQINSYFGLDLKSVPTMDNYRQIEEAVIKRTMMSDGIPKKPIADSEGLKKLLVNKEERGEWVKLSPAKGEIKYYLTDHALYETVGDTVTGIGLFNREEAEVYKLNDGMLPELAKKPKEYGANQNCMSIISKFLFK